MFRKILASLMSNHSIVCFLVLIALSMLVIGCTAPTMQNTSASTPVISATTPFKIAILIDKTLSVSDHDVSELTMNDVDRLVRKLRDISGELALGIIHSESDLVLRRLRITRRPVEPIMERENNPLLRMKKRRSYRERLAVFEADLDTWTNRTEAEIARWRDQIAPLLTQEPDAQATDFYGAVGRALFFLTENNSLWEREPIKVLLVLSDCEDTIGKNSWQVPSDCIVVLVTDIENREALSDFDAYTFENAEAAVYHIEMLMDQHRLRQEQTLD